MRSLDDIVRMNEERAKEMLAEKNMAIKERDELIVRRDNLIAKAEAYDKELAQKLREEFGVK